MTFPRRIFIIQILKRTYSLIGLSLLSLSCDRSTPKNAVKERVDPCTDLSELEDSDLEVRRNLGYTSNTPIAERKCLNCKLYIKTDESLSCGSCLVIKGPVVDSGYCTVWAPLDV